MDSRPLYQHGLGLASDPPGMSRPPGAYFVSTTRVFDWQLLTLLFSLRKFINDENWYLNLNRARHLEPHARFVRPKCIHSRQMDVTQGSKAGAPEDPELALYVGPACPIKLDSC